MSLTAFANPICNVCLSQFYDANLRICCSHSAKTKQELFCVAYAVSYHRPVSYAIYPITLIDDNECWHYYPDDVSRATVIY